MWYIGDNELNKELPKALKKFRDKYNKEPQTILVPQGLPIPEITADLEIIADKYVLDKHIEITSSTISSTNGHD